jgi:hypothetical protein
MRWAGPVALMEVQRVLLGKPEGKIPLGRSRRRWENNIKRYFKELCVTAWI